MLQQDTEPVIDSQPREHSRYKLKVYTIYTDPVEWASWAKHSETLHSRPKDSRTVVLAWPPSLLTTTRLIRWHSIAHRFKTLKLTVLCYADAILAI